MTLSPLHTLGGSGGGPGCNLWQEREMLVALVALGPAHWREYMIWAWPGLATSDTNATLAPPSGSRSTWKKSSSVRSPPKMLQFKPWSHSDPLWIAERITSACANVG